MKLRQLKEKLLKTKKFNTFTILLCPDTTFVANQYIDFVCKNGNMEYNLINSLSETTESALSLVFDFAEKLNVLKVAVFNEFYDDYSQFNSCVVICNKIDPKLKEKVLEFTVTFDSLEDWQIEDYILNKCPGLSRQEASWLNQAANKDLYRIDSELDKIALFEPEKQLIVFNSLRFEQDTDLVIFGPYDVVNAIVAQDKAKIAEYFRYQKVISEEPVSLSVGLLKNFKKIMFVKYTNAKPEEIGISAGQYNYIKRNNNLTKNYLVNAINFLSDIDLRVRSGKIAIKYDSLLDYILLKLFSLSR